MAHYELGEFAAAVDEFKAAYELIAGAGPLVQPRAGEPPRQRLRAGAALLSHLPAACGPTRPTATTSRSASPSSSRSSSSAAHAPRPIAGRRRRRRCRAAGTDRARRPRTSRSAPCRRAGGRRRSQASSSAWPASACARRRHRARRRRARRAEQLSKLAATMGNWSAEQSKLYDDRPARRHVGDRALRRRRRGGGDGRDPLRRRRQARSRAALPWRRSPGGGAQAVFSCDF